MHRRRHGPDGTADRRDGAQRVAQVLGDAGHHPPADRRHHQRVDLAGGDPLLVQGFLRDDEEYWPFEGEDWPDEYIERYGDEAARKKP